MSIYLRFKRKNQTVFLHCKAQESLGDVKGRLAELLQQDPDEVRCLKVSNCSVVEFAPAAILENPSLAVAAQPFPPSHRVLDDKKTLQDQQLASDSIVYFVYPTKGLNAAHACIGVASGAGCMQTTSGRKSILTMEPIRALCSNRILPPTRKAARSGGAAL